VGYHASELAEAARAAPIDMLSLRIAGCEQRALKQQRLGHFEPAIQALEKLIGGKELSKDVERRAWLSALAARVAYQMEDEGRGQKFETNAYLLNNNHSPPRTRPAYVSRPRPGRQAATIVARLLKYDRRGAMIADYDEAVAELVTGASAGRYEEALANLGSFLGFEAERPEKVHGVGPDVLWRTDGVFDFVIEAKSEKQEDSPLYKKDHAQLLEAEHWFKEAYPGRDALRVSALPEPVADPKATPVGTFALRLNEITKLVGALRGVLLELISCTGEADALRERCETLFAKARLKPDGIKATYLSEFGKKAKGG
jgi:replicative superfamily II helicase